MNAPTNGQTDLFRLDWVMIEEAAELCGFPAPWLMDQLLAGHLGGIATKVATIKESPDKYGISVWLPSVGVWAHANRELLTGGMALLRNGDESRHRRG